MASSRTKPPASPPATITPLLQAWGGGDASAGERLFRAVYAELHAQAARAMRRESIGHTLQTTALVHEAYLRLVERTGLAWHDRAHFYGVAARVMHHVLVDHARARRTAKRGSGNNRLTLSPLDAPEQEHAARVDLLALHEALTRLATLDPEQARLVELRYFGGLTIEETAEALRVSPASVKREWAIARGWLRRELGVP